MRLNQAIKNVLREEVDDSEENKINIINQLNITGKKYIVDEQFNSYFRRGFRLFKNPLNLV